MSAIVFADHSTALAKKHLSQKILTDLENKITATGFTLAKAVASGLKNPDSSIGIYAGDTDTYTVFSQVFDPIICDYHKTDLTCPHPDEIAQVVLDNPDPENNFILSTRIRVARNLAHYRFPCHIQLEDRKIVEKKCTQALNAMPEPLSGTYFSLEDNDPGKHHKMADENLLFEKGDRFQDAAGFNTDFPKGRGVFLSSDQQFRVWINEEDHLRIISMEETADISRVYNRLMAGLNTLGSHLKFAWHDTYGYLASCPTNIGTAMRAGVHIQLKKLAKNKELLNQIAHTHQLQIRGTFGEKTDVKNAVFDISNKQRLGIGHGDILHSLHAGITALIKAEKQQ